MMKMKFAESGLLLALCVVGVQAQDKGGKAPAGKGPGTPPMVLTSTAFADGADIPAKYTQVAGDAVISPELNWTNVPANTQTFALLMHDPDVARNRTTEDMTHWIIWNIPGTAKSLHENVPSQPTLPDGTVQGRNGGNTVGYRGPGAPAIAPRHHYTFELFALDTKLDLGPETPRAELMQALNGHILGKAVYVGLFHRPN